MNAPARRTRCSILFAAALALGVFAIFTPGCNTTAGVGEDLQAGGRALENAAEDAND